MKIADVFANDMASTYKLSSMILPQISEADSHIVQVVGMFFFDDNILSLRKWRSSRGARLAKIAEEKNILLMACDQCALRRNLAEGEFSSVWNRRS